MSVLVACGGDDDVVPEDSGAQPALCESDEECDDGEFCNGAERCDPGARAANERGCVEADAPCETCDEEQDECICENPDADGDGEPSMDCGGADCDDNNARRFPGNVEICDGLVDEDCDMSTLGDDADADGFTDITCCNRADGVSACGTDCDDSRATINPEAVESCNEIDDDCDGLIDEQVQAVFYRDADNDTFGSTETVDACAAPPGYSSISGDCDDTDPLVFPGATETCDGAVDHDCDAAVDNGCDCVDDMVRECGQLDGMGGFSSVGSCEVGSQRCINGFWGTCVGATVARAELCDGTDDDCDGVVDDEFACMQGETGGCQTTCGTSGQQSCRGDCLGFEACRTTDEGPSDPTTCNGCDDDLDGVIDDNFECEMGEALSCSTACGTMGLSTCGNDCTAGPCSAAEACNYCDDDGVDGFALAEWPMAQTDAADDRVECMGQPFVYGGPGTTCNREFSLGGYTDWLELAQEGVADTVWTAYRNTALIQGYGETSVSVEVHASSSDASPGRGWALILRETGGVDHGANVEGTWALPNDRPGIALVWLFSSAAGVDGPDEVRIYRLGGSGGPQWLPLCAPGVGCITIRPTSAHLDSGGSAVQNITLRYIPDDPTQAGTQQEVRIEGDVNSSQLVRGSLFFGTDNLLPAGTPIEWGFVSFSDTGTARTRVRLANRVITLPFTTYVINAQMAKLCAP